MITSRIWPRSLQLVSASSCKVVGRKGNCVGTVRAFSVRDAEITDISSIGSTGALEWDGLARWRSFLDSERGLGKKGITSLVTTQWDTDCRSVELPCSLAERAALVLNNPDPLAKAALSHRIFEDLLSFDTHLGSAEAPTKPARPTRPELVHPWELPKQKDSGLPTSPFMLHQLAHIELNAIDLAWDTVVRFAHLSLPMQFYLDFARVADDEGRHLGWCLQRMSELGHEYGDMPAHNLLWEGCTATSNNLQARLAVVPMSQEARGLDAGPRLVQRLVGLGDNRSAAIVARISEEERAHVAVGVSWFVRICHALSQEEGQQFRNQMATVNPDGSLLKGPFNDADRKLVGLLPTWYNTDCWVGSDKQRITRDNFLNSPSYACAPESDLSPTDLELLRQRLAHFSEMEVDNCAQQPSVVSS